MLFELVVALLGFGLLTWVIGYYFEFMSIAIIGSAFVLIAGSAVALTGLEIRTGETRQFSYQLENNGNDYVKNQTRIRYHYETTTLAALLNIGVLGSLGIGGLLMLLGAAMMSHSLQMES